MELTEKIFWEKFWAEVRLPQTVNYSFKNDRVIAQIIKKYIPVAQDDKTIVEIGCAPGKWLVMFNKELGYKIVGYEYCEPAYFKTIENLASNRIDKEKFNIKLVDFLKADFVETYDVVLSLGFIEHFDDTENIFLKHVQLLNKTGYLIIGIPNFRGINYYLQSIIDKYLDQKIIPNHNLNAMDPSIMDTFSSKNELNKVFSGYVGGFEADLFNSSAIKPIILKLFIKSIIKILSLVLKKVNSKYSSGYIMAIYKKGN